MKSKKLEKQIFNAIWVIVAIIWGIVCIFPLWWVINILFSSLGSASSIHFTLFPNSLSAGLQTLKLVFTEGGFLGSYVVSLGYSGFQMIGAVIIASMAAYEFSFYRFPGKNVLFILALSSMMIPIAVTIIPAFRILVTLKWLNSLAGLVVPGLANALALFICRQFMEKLPKELLEAAEMDGTGHFRKYWNIVLPLSRNACITGGVIVFINAWGNYIWPLVVVQKSDMYTVSLLVNYFVSEGGHKTTTQILGALFLAAIVPIIIYIFMRKYVMEGIASTGVKG